MHPDDGRPPPHRHSHATRRTLATLTASALLALPAVAFAASAQADDTCTPADAWTETVPAVGDRTIVVDNPDYVPAVPPVYETVTHPAVTETATQYQRYSWNPRGQDEQVPPAGSTPATDDRWQANTSNYENGHSGEPVGVAFSVSNPNGQGNASWFFWTADQVVTVITAAWDEEVLVTPGIPAQGDPQIEVENLDYVPGYEIDHPAVLCTTDPPTDPPAETPAETPTTTTTETPTVVASSESATAPSTLAETGASTWTAAILATVLALVGTVLTVVSHRRTAGQR